MDNEKNLNLINSLIERTDSLRGFYLSKEGSFFYEMMVKVANGFVSASEFGIYGDTQEMVEKIREARDVQKFLRDNIDKITTYKELSKTVGLFSVSESDTIARIMNLDVFVKDGTSVYPFVIEEDGVTFYRKMRHIQKASPVEYLKNAMEDGEKIKADKKYVEEVKIPETLWQKLLEKNPITKSAMAEIHFLKYKSDSQIFAENLFNKFVSVLGKEVKESTISMPSEVLSLNATIGNFKYQISSYPDGRADLGILDKDGNSTLNAYPNVMDNLESVLEHIEKMKRENVYSQVFGDLKKPKM